MKRQAGFTLLEMLAALTLMAVCSSVLLVAFGQSARALSQVARSDRLNHAALTVLDQEAAGPLTEGTRQRRRASRLSLNEIMTILIYFHLNLNY